jgi:hypothetical protein
MYDISGVKESLQLNHLIIAIKSFDLILAKLCGMRKPLVCVISMPLVQRQDLYGCSNQCLEVLHPFEHFSELGGRQLS